MITIHTEKCTGCRRCERNCPVGAITVVERIARVNPDSCVVCGVCVRICNFEAVEKSGEEVEGRLVCTSCPINCAIPPGKTGACRRFYHDGSNLLRKRRLVVDSITSSPATSLPYRPLVTAVGSGTNYPCFKPAPLIVQDSYEGVDVITVVTEAPLSYSGVKVKIDANRHIGEEGARVKREGAVVGLVTTEEYGAKMLTLGGVNILSGSSDGFIAARTIVDLANGERVSLKVENGSKLQIQRGKRPIIDGEEEKLMRIGCGSATMGIMGQHFAEAADEVIVLDFHVIGLLTEHAAGRELGLNYSGIIPVGRKSTNGRYFGDHGHGWGGTNIDNPLQAVKDVDMNKAWPGLKVLVTETTGQKAAMLEVTSDGSVEEVPMTEKAEKVIQVLAENCEESCVSVIYTGGTGGSARAGVTRLPKKLTEAIHREEVRLTIGGAPTFVLPGGGINFMVDISKVIPGAFSWVPTPATVAPVEYTMTREKYEEIGGHTRHIKTKQQLLKELEREDERK